jgi:hypothetical protein
LYLKITTKGIMIIRARQFAVADTKLIKQTIAANTSLSRRKLSILISQKLNRRQPNGHLKDRACRDVLSRLDRKGIITLPKPSCTFKTQTAGVKQIHFTEPTEAITGTPGDFPMPIFKMIETDRQRQLWNYLIDTYHYKGCRIVVGRHLNYLVYLNQDIIGCFCFADPVLQLKSRDGLVGIINKEKQIFTWLLIMSAFLFCHG